MRKYGLIKREKTTSALQRKTYLLFFDQLGNDVISRH
jgi:hypothetical protein